VSEAPHAGCVIVAQPGPRLSDGLRGWLQCSFEAVFVVADRPSLLAGAQHLQPALVLLDLTLAEGRLGVLLGELQQRAPASRTLVLSDHDDAAIDAATLAAGASGVVHKATLAAELWPAVDAVLAGRRGVAVDAAPPNPLSPP
jgi:DNA-binding NarL/FixJ family response regulator